MKKLGIFGGSFNPVHMGHLSLAIGCQEAYHFDKLLMIPDNLPPHKSAYALASNDDRINMLRISIKGYTHFQASDIEYELGGKSYTVRTVSAIRKKYPDWQLFLLIGSDMLFTFDQWREYQTILQETTLITASRHDDEYEKLCSFKLKFGKLSNKIQILELPVIDVSSTEIRRMLKSGKDPGLLLPFGVFDYIKKQKLYVI